MAHNNGHDDQEQEGGHHIVPVHVLTNVLLFLLAMTALTVITGRMHLGVWAGPVAFSIATVKAFMVMAFFMGLKYDSRSNRIIFSSGFFFLFVLWFFSTLDIWTRVLQNSVL